MQRITIKERTETVYNIFDFPYQEMALGYKTHKHHKICYINLPCAFDIETTTIRCPEMENCDTFKKGLCRNSYEYCHRWIEPYAFMYQWQACINDKVCFGRTWQEFIDFINKLSLYFETGKGKRLVIYVHNLPFEWAFMSRFFRWKEVFSSDKRKPMKAVTDSGIEFRCSYKLSNMSLEKFCENTPDCYYQKMTGEYNYDIIRTPETPLTNTESAYCYCDVRGLCECITYLLQEDTIASIPLTSTGFVRRDCRRAVLANQRNKKRVRKERLTVKQYIICRDAFRGGDTHASYMYAGENIYNVESRDISSSYPYVMMTEKFPSHFIEGNKTKLDDYLKNDLAVLTVVSMKKVRYTGNDYIPYIPLSKCRCMFEDKEYTLDRLFKKMNRMKIDNGRVLEADCFEITLTDVDWDIIKNSYDFDYEIKEIYVSKKRFLPKELREKILEYFTAKSTLKGIQDNEYEYMKSKNRLNGIYGMCVTDIIKDEWLYNDGEWSTNEADKKKQLKYYYESKNAFLSYQWGVWVTAYARRNLRKALAFTKSDTIYVDTDSVKFTGNHRTEFKTYNENVINTIRSVDVRPEIYHNGKQYVMGIMEEDGFYNEFITWGAKKYCYKTDGEYHTTVAGLAKNAGSSRINKDGIEAFVPGTVFYPSGRTRAIYGDDDIHTITVNGTSIITAGYLALIPTTYRLDITPEYEILIK